MRNILTQMDGASSGDAWTGVLTIMIGIVVQANDNNASKRYIQTIVTTRVY